MSVTIVMADDHAVVRESLSAYLGSTPDLRVVAAVPDGEKAVEAVARHAPNIVLLDIDMPGMGAFEVAQLIKRRWPATRIVMLSAFFNDRYIEQALAAGASGYITKTESAENLVRAIREVSAGAAYFSPAVRGRLVVGDAGVRLSESAGNTRASQLSARELEVLRYVSRGMANKEIATSLHLACRTVDHHIARLMHKLDLHGRVALARFAVREGLAEA
jgi:DNA-binding NarL/FixJ family response regulator